MHRPLRVPFHLRIWDLIRGLFLYNTVYWRRASDGLNMPSLSPEERERQRPERNLEIIKPRVRPRARIEATGGAEVSNPKALTPPEPVPEAPVDAPTASDPGIASQPHRMETSEDGTGQIYVKKRRYRRRLVARGSAIDQGSFIARVFGKK